MNAPLRRVGVVVLVLFGLLFVNLNWVQAYKADAYRTNEHNGRVQLSEYQHQRGSIVLADRKTIVAQSVATGDSLKYLRQYPLGLPFAQIIGYKPVNGAATGIERAEDDFLSGNSDVLFTNRIKDMFTGNKTGGGNVILTLSKGAQEAAYNGLLHNEKNATVGAAVAIDPSTGGILALASIPSFDPNPLASHQASVSSAAYKADNAKAGQPLLNHGYQSVYPPASTMKVIIASAALASGSYTPQTPVQAGNSYTPIPGTAFTMHNSSPQTCPQDQITLLRALTVSCNTAFARIGVGLGADKINAMAQGYGFEDGSLTLAGSGNATIKVAPSHTGQMRDPNEVAQSSIGQLNVAESPLQDAMIAATVANGGVQMRPYLVSQLQAPDLNIVDTTQPKTLRTPISPQVAASLQTMMESVVANGTAKKAAIDGYDVGGKTGTAQNDDAGDVHGWFIGFAMKDGKPIVAVCVFLEHAGVGGSAEAARIGGDIMRAAIADKGSK